MFLKNLKLTNFRKFNSLDLELNPGLNLLVGENDSGKSAIVDAIKIVLLTHSRESIRLDINDFYHDETGKTKELKIECLFEFPDDNQAKNFLEWGHFDQAGNFFLRIFLKAEQENDHYVLPYYEVRGGIDDEGARLDGEARELLRATYLKPLRDAEFELAPRRGSRLSQILDNHSIFSNKSNHSILEILRFANKEVDKFFKGENTTHGDLKKSFAEFLTIKGVTGVDEDIENLISELKFGQGESGVTLSASIDRFLVSFFGKELSSKFEISPPSLKGILERLSLELDQHNSGLGSHNLLFIATELLLLEKSDDFTGLRLALIEEIEAHLHPQAQMRLVEFLQKECDEKKVQMILSSHSPNLASKVKLKNLILCKDGWAFPMGPIHTKLEEEDYEFLERFLDVSKANLFFANGLILVEGDSENLLLPVLAKALGKDLTKAGVSVINLGGISFRRYERIFLRNSEPKMKVPVSIVTDLDIRPLVWFSSRNEPLPTYLTLPTDKVALLNDSYPAVFDIEIKDNTFPSQKFAEDFFRASLKNGKTRLPAGFKQELHSALVSRTIQDHEHGEVKETVRIAKIKDHSSDSNQGFVSNNWTLEFEIAKSSIQHLFYTAILLAIESEVFDSEKIQEIKVRALSDIQSWNQQSEDEIAFKIYWEIMLGRETNPISKAIVSQYFAKILELENPDDLKAKLESDQSLKYLVDAISHASSLT